MIPVMIVDDELIVRVALKSIVNWEEMGFQIVCEAKNGQEGLTRYRQMHPKLILTDVMMPEMTGLEMMDEIRKEDAQVRFIVLSAYDDFKFAQYAVRMHAEEYILKATMLEEDLTALLRRMFRQIVEQQDSGMKAAPTDHTSMAQALAEGEVPASAESLFVNADLMAVFCRLVGAGKSERDMRVLLSIVENTMGDSGLRCTMGMWKTGVLLFLEQAPPEQLARITALLHDTVHKYLDAELRIGLADENGDLEGCRRLAEEAEHASVLTLFEPDASFCRFRERGKVETVSAGVLRQLRESLLLRQPEQAVAIIAGQFDRVEQARDRELLYELVLALSALLCECRGMTEPDKPERVMQIDDITRIREYYTVSAYAAVAHLQAHERRINPYVRSVNTLIATRYAEELTLGQIAEELHLSTSYLGKLFFAETGSYVMDVLTKARVEQACKLLADGEQSLAYIAEAVGFGSQSYFSRQFQKIKGMSPRNYRKKSENLTNEI